MQHKHDHCGICKVQDNCHGLPFFWPVHCFVGCETLEALKKNLEFLKVVDETLSLYMMGQVHSQGKKALEVPIVISGKTIMAFYVP